jgi:hypothetical protein
LSKESADDELDRQIIRVVETAKPESVQQLVNQVQAVSQRPEQEIIDRILKLQREERIRLKQAQMPTPEKLRGYLSSNQARWYWITLALTAAAAIVVFTVPENAFPLAYLRNVLGTIFVLWLPGYAFIKALFPQHIRFTRGQRGPSETSQKDLDTIEAIALSVGMSLALVAIAGLLLNNTPWGISLMSIVLSLVALTTIFATAAVIREYQTRTQKTAGAL